MQKNSKIVLFFSLTSLTIGSIITSIIFSHSNKDGGQWPLVFFFMELMNIVYLSFFMLAFSIRPVSAWLAIMHAVCLTMALLLLENFNFIWENFLFDKGMDKIRVIVVNFAQDGLILPLIYISFLLLFLFLPKDKLTKSLTRSNFEEGY